MSCDVKGLDGVYIGIRVCINQNDKSIEERMGEHLSISIEDVLSLIVKKFSRHGIDKKEIKHEHTDDGYCQYIFSIKLKKRCRIKTNVPDVFDWGYINYHNTHRRQIKSQVSLMANLLLAKTIEERKEILRNTNDDKLILYGDIGKILENCKRLSVDISQEPQILTSKPKKRSRSPLTKRLCPTCMQDP